MEDFDEDTEGQDSSQPPRTAVLWEKCFEQSIFVDLSEDESLHFSDLESSFPVHLSQESAASEASLHLSGNPELLALEDSSSSECGSASSKDEENVMKARSNNSLKQGSPPRPRNIQGEPPSNQDDEDLGQNTSDEDQEDLPFDGDLGSPYFNQTSSTERDTSSDERETPHQSPEWNGMADSRVNYTAQNHSLTEMTVKDPEPRSQEQSAHRAENHSSASKPANMAAPTCGGAPVPVAPQPDITQLLLRHFSREELVCSGKLIEAETLPEVSLLESVDDTPRSTALKNNPAGVPREEATGRGIPTQGDYTHQWSSEGSCDRTADEASDSASETADSVDQRADDSVMEDLSSAARGGSASTADTPEHAGEDRRLTARDAPVDVDNAPLVRARSCSELKYGQGQVHYPLPDFSKVAPKVRIPKAPSCPITTTAATATTTTATTTTTSSSSRPTTQPPSTMHRAQSSPGILGLISRVLEDSVQAPERPYVFTDQERQTNNPGMVHHLQAEYDKLLTKYAEAENLIDEMRLGNKPQTPSEDLLELESVDYQGLQGSHFEAFIPPHSPPAVKFSEDLLHKGTIKRMMLNEVPFSQPSEQEPTDGEIMTSELRDIISEFMEKVEEFKGNLNNSSISLADQHMVLRSMMEAQDQLERKYISNKEEHRALEMQNYIGLCRNTGTFDPDRLVEGDIFRIGMHLEDVKEMIDRNVLSHVSPPHSSSTPAPMSPMLGVNPCQPHISDPSPSSFQYEEPSAWFPASAYEMWGPAEYKEDEEKDTSEDQGNSELQQSTESSPTHSSEHSSPPPQSSHTDPHWLQDSLEGLDISASAASAAAAVDDEEEQVVERRCSFSERKVPDDALACVTGSTSSSRQTQWTLESIYTQDSSLGTGSEWELAAGNSLAGNDSQAANDSLDSSYSLAAFDNLAASDFPAVELSSSHVSETHSLSLSQRIVSPETDSGFGSSDLLQPGVQQSDLLTESDGAVVHTGGDGLSVSDSEESSSALQTAIHPPAHPTDPPRSRARMWGSPPPASQSKSQTQHVLTKTPDGGAAAAAVELWVENTTKERPIRRQGHLHQSSTKQVKHHLSEPTLGEAVHTPQRCDRLHSCSCNSEALAALQTEMSQLKKDLEDGLVQLPHLAQKMDYLTSKFRLDRQDRQSKARPRSQTRRSCNSVWKSVGRQSELWEDGSRPGSNPLKLEHWISSDMEQSKSKDSGKADDSTVMLQFHNAPVGGSRESGSSLHLCSELPREPQGTIPAYRGKDVRRVHSRDKLCLPSPPSLQKPLLQVNYTSSCSLPASYKVKEPMQPTSNHRKRSVQSDSALLPSNVFFQRTPSPALEHPRTGGRASRRRGSKEEEMNRTLDRALEAARCMKRTTDRMAKSLSADLAKAQLHRKLQHTQPLGGRRGTAL